MEQLSQLIQRDMIVRKEVVGPLVDYANVRGFIAKTFVDRRNHYVVLEREGTGTTALPKRK